MIDQQSNKPRRKKKSGGCLIYGCLFSLLFLVILLVGGGVAAYLFIKSQVRQYTSDQPIELPVVDYPAEKLNELEKHLEQFSKGGNTGDKPEALVLTAADLNALIAKDKDLKGRIYVSIKDDQISGQVSIPTDLLPGGEGRFFNAFATFNVSLRNGELIVTLAEARIQDKEVPEEIMEALRKENLAKDISQDKEVAEILGKFESLTIKNGKVILQPLAPTKDDKQKDDKQKDDKQKDDKQKDDKQNSAKKIDDKQ